MGASVIAYWPGITEQQIEEQPSFYNDSKAWGNWMAEREEEPEVIQAVIGLDASAVLTFTTDGIADEDVEWVTPRQLQEAAGKLRQAVSERSPGTGRILEVYARHANDVDPIDEEFMKDLEDVESIARWAEEQGAAKMTLEVNW